MTQEAGTPHCEYIDRNNNSGWLKASNIHIGHPISIQWFPHHKIYTIFLVNIIAYSIGGAIDTPGIDGIAGTRTTGVVLLVLNIVLYWYYWSAGIYY